MYSQGYRRAPPLFLRNRCEPGLNRWGEHPTHWMMHSAEWSLNLLTTLLGRTGGSHACTTPMARITEMPCKLVSKLVTYMQKFIPPWHALSRSNFNLENVSTENSTLDLPLTPKGRKKKSKGCLWRTQKIAVFLSTFLVKTHLINDIKGWRGTLVLLWNPPIFPPAIRG